MSDNKNPKNEILDRRKAMLAGLATVGGVGVTAWTKPAIETVITPSHAHTTVNEAPLFGTVSSEEMAGLRRSKESIAVTNDDIIGDALSMLVPDANASHANIEPVDFEPGDIATTCVGFSGECITVVPPTLSEGPTNTPFMIIDGETIDLFMQNDSDFKGEIGEGSGTYVVNGFFDESYNSCQGTINGDGCAVEFSASSSGLPCSNQQ